MTKPAAETWHYVIAQQHDMGGYRTIRLLGPFATERAAWAMIRPVRLAIRKHYPDEYKYADVLTRTEKIKVGDRVPAGALDLRTVVDDDWIEQLCNG